MFSSWKTNKIGNLFSFIFMEKKTCLIHTHILKTSDGIEVGGESLELGVDQGAGSY